MEAARQSLERLDPLCGYPCLYAGGLEPGVVTCFAIPWGQGHGGNYDLEALFDWIEVISE